MKGKHVGEIRKSNSCGNFEVLEYIGDKKYMIRFLNTGTTKNVFGTNILSGRITDEAIKNNLGKYRIGDILRSEKYGEVEILDIIKKKRNESASTSKLRTLIKIKFLDTGYVTICDPNGFLKNKVRDYLKPNVQNVGILGYVEHLSGRLRDMKEYRIWESVLRRCYGIDDYTKQDSSYEFAEVEDRWKRFDYFLEDIIHIKGYDLWKRFAEEYPSSKNIFEFDKDTIVKGNKIYSRNTCRFIPKFINAGYTSWASENKKGLLLDELEVLDYESIINEAKSRGLL